MVWNYLSIPKLQRLHRWSLRMDKYFHPTLNWASDCLHMLGLKLNNVSKKGYWLFNIWMTGSCNQLLVELLLCAWQMFPQIIPSEINAECIRLFYQSTLVVKVLVTLDFANVELSRSEHRTAYRLMTVSFDAYPGKLDLLRGWLY